MSIETLIAELVRKERVLTLMIKQPENYDCLRDLIKARIRAQKQIIALGEMLEKVAV